MSTLTDFLLARLAEDEAPTWTLSPYACEPGCCAPGGWVGAQCRYCDPSPVYGGTVAAITRIAEEHAETIHQRSHVLARCKADRLIVELCTVDYEDSRTSGDDGATLAEEVLHALALPYFDHPDYAEATR